MQTIPSYYHFPLSFFKSAQETVNFPFKDSAALNLPLSLSSGTQKETFQLNEVSMSELKTTIQEKRKTIENQLTALERQAQPIEAWAAFIGFLDETTSTAHENIQGGLIFLEHVLPHKTLEKLKSIPLSTHHLGNAATLGLSFLQALDAGSQGVALISKEKILQESRKILQTLQDRLHKEATLEDLPALQKMLKEWEAQLHLEEIALSEEKKSFGINTSYTLLSCVHLFLTYIPIKPLLPYMAFLTTGLSWAMSGLEVINLQIEATKASNDQKTLHEWKKHLAALQEKRKKRETDQLSTLKTHFESLEPQIKTMRKKHCLRFFKELKQAVQKANPHYREQVIENELESWNHQPFTNPLKDLKPKELNHTLFQEGAEEKFFDLWYAAQSKEMLITFYMDHQATIQITTKHALKQMVNKKYKKEEHLIDLKKISSFLQLGASIATLTFDIILVVLGMITFPLLSLGSLFLFMSLGPIVARFGLSGAHYYHTFKINPKQGLALLSGVEIGIRWAKLQIAVRSYFHDAKKKRLIEAIHSLRCALPLNGSNPLAHEQAKKAQREFQQSQAQITQWEQRLQKLENTLQQAGWEDFAVKASLPKDADFDSLSELQTALLSCPLDLLDPDLKNLLTEYMGLDIQDLEEQLKENSGKIKQILKQFFALSDSDLVDFINQHRRKNT